MSVFLWGSVYLSAEAADIRSGQNIYVGQGERVAGNLYGASDTVSISGETGGDAVMAGGNVVVSGRVGQDVLAAGGTVDVLGSVGGDARIAGGTVTVAGPVGGDVVVAGGTTHIVSGATVGGDVLVWSGNVVVDGVVNGSVRVRGGSIRVDGTVRGGMDMTSSGPIVLGSNATVAGDIVYRSPQMIIVENGATVSGRVARQALPETANQGFQQGAKSILATLSLLNLLALLVAGWLLFWLFPSTSLVLIARAYERPWRSLGLGALFFLVMPLILLVLMLLVIGWYVAVFFGLIYLFFLLVAHIYAGILLGSWILKLYRRDQAMSLTWYSVMGGILLLFIISFIPVLGWLIGAALFLMVLGSTADLFSTRVRGVMMTPEERM